MSRRRALAAANARWVATAPPLTARRRYVLARHAPEGRLVARQVDGRQRLAGVFRQAGARVADVGHAQRCAAHKARDGCCATQAVVHLAGMQRAVRLLERRCVRRLEREHQRRLAQQRRRHLRVARSARAGARATRRTRQPVAPTARRPRVKARHAAPCGEGHVSDRRARRAQRSRCAILRRKPRSASGGEIAAGRRAYGTARRRRRRSRTFSAANCAHCVPFSPWPSKTPKKWSPAAPPNAGSTLNASWLSFVGASG